LGPARSAAPEPSGRGSQSVQSGLCAGDEPFAGHRHEQDAGHRGVDRADDQPVLSALVTRHFLVCRDGLHRDAGALVVYAQACAAAGWRGGSGLKKRPGRLIHPGLFPVRRLNLFDVMRAGLLAHFLGGNTGGQFDQLERAVVVGPRKHGQIGYDHVHHIAPRQRQRAGRDELGAAILGAMLHHHDDLLDARDQIHSAAHALDHLARDHPVGDVAILGHFHRAKDGQVDMAATDHGKALRAVEIGRMGQLADRLLARIDEVGVFLALIGERADAQHPVLALQRHGLPGRVAGLDQPVDENAGCDDGFGVERAQFNNLRHLHNGRPRRARHDRPEIARRLAIDKIAPAVASMRLDQRDIGMDRLFEDVMPPVDLAGFLAFGQ
ncbi:hypothetical protein E4T56_gene15747, partial [Termitomyces sp. T112]